MGRHERARAPPTGKENTHQDPDTPALPSLRRHAQLCLRLATPRIKAISDGAG
jgi:hypothetical protein